MDTAQLVQEIRGHLPDCLVALDYDGTLAPIVDDPAAARPAPDVAEVAERLVGRGAEVVLVSGRDVDTLLRLCGLRELPRLRIAGLYGAEQWHDGTLTAATPPSGLAAVRAALPDVLLAAQADPALWTEDKGLSLVIHARRAEQPNAALRHVERPVADLARRHDLDVHRGRHVLEVRLAGFDKGAALRRLLEQSGREAVLYVGDDVGDLPAFDVVREWRAAGHPGWTVAVASDEAADVATQADVTVADPAELVALLAALADGGQGRLANR